MELRQSCLLRSLCKPGERSDRGQASGLRHFSTTNLHSQSQSGDQAQSGPLGPTQPPPVTCIPSELSLASWWPLEEAQQLSCCTADYLGAAHSLLSMSTSALPGSVSLHLVLISASYSSQLCKEPRTCPRAEVPWGWSSAPTGLHGRDQGCFHPTAVNAVTAQPGLCRGQMRSKCVL